MTCFRRGKRRFCVGYGGSLPELRVEVTQQRSRKNGGKV
jgi:hypothetical protein